jgi:hypothetical protein
MTATSHRAQAVGVPIENLATTPSRNSGPCAISTRPPGCRRRTGSREIRPGRRTRPKSWRALNRRRRAEGDGVRRGGDPLEGSSRGPRTIGFAITPLATYLARLRAAARGLTQAEMTNYREMRDQIAAEHDADAKAERRRARASRRRRHQPLPEPVLGAEPYGARQCASCKRWFTRKAYNRNARWLCASCWRKRGGSRQ